MKKADMFTDDGTPVPVNVILEDYQIGWNERGAQYVPVLDESGIRFLAELVKDRPRKKFDCNILYTGKRRTGKTTLAIEVAQAIDPGLRVEQITFRLDDFNKVLAENPYADPSTGIWPQVILDEAGFDLFSLDFMKRYQKNLVKKLQVIGLKNQIVHFVLPHRRKLNKSIREEIISYWINVRGGFGQSRGFAEVREGEENIFEENMYWRPKFCFTYPDLNNDLWATYMTKKTAFVDEVCTVPTDFDDEPGKNSARDQLIREYYQYRRRSKDPINQAELGKIVGLAQRTISLIINQGRE